MNFNLESGVWILVFSWSFWPESVHCLLDWIGMEGRYYFPRLELNSSRFSSPTRSCMTGLLYSTFSHQKMEKVNGRVKIKERIFLVSSLFVSLLTSIRALLSIQEPSAFGSSKIKMSLSMLRIFGFCTSNILIYEKRNTKKYLILYKVPICR